LDALREFRSAERLAPGYEGAMKIGGLSLRLGLTEDAVDSYRHALEFRPNSVPACLALCRAQADLFRDDAAFLALDRAAEIEPESSEIPLARGHLLQMLGRFGEAEEEFEHALARDDSLGIAYQGLIGGKRIVEADRPLLERVRAVLRRPGLSPSNEINLHFALGKALDDLGDYEEAMTAFDAANRILFRTQLQGRVLDPKLLGAQIDARIKMYSAGFFARAPRCSNSVNPIFVVGMLRSGTTLFEQLISGHPAVAAAGELSFWAHAEARLVDYRSRTVDWAGVDRAANDYLESTENTARARPGAEVTRVTDKYPANFLSLGLIHCALPNARIIHMRRHPVDTAISIYTTPLRTPPNYGCDKANIALYFSQYLRLMSHWRQVLPSSRFMEIDYEDLVQNSEPTMRRALDFCGLDWNDACMHPEHNPRSVRTPSFWQVRQPLFTSSIGRWRHYLPWLGALGQLLPPIEPSSS
jgi:tetratricopeptide (TPR) repeat protein